MRRLNALLRLPGSSLRFLLGLAKIHRDSKHRFRLKLRDVRPYLSDSVQTTPFDKHYIYHTAWAARRLAVNRPALHTDFASSLYFVAIASAHVEIKFFDYRPAHLELSNVSSGHADLCALTFPNGSLESVSCMHVIEHVGLGRYGDPLDADADIRAMQELRRVIMPGGRLLLVVPLGGEARIVFNAHRIYTQDFILGQFPDFIVDEFMLITDQGQSPDVILNPSPEQLQRQRYACGCFDLRRAASL